MTSLCCINTTKRPHLSFNNEQNKRNNLLDRTLDVHLPVRFYSFFCFNLPVVYRFVLHSLYSNFNNLRIFRTLLFLSSFALYFHVTDLLPRPQCNTQACTYDISL
ncbi:hypothetical protein BDF14DRAFT_23811 [Spinellus fusiger]|nr:hypothetical protein BDF14DRAFT_23811 [Spinellus fusiger]